MKSSESPPLIVQGMLAGCAVHPSGAATRSVPDCDTGLRFTYVAVTVTDLPISTESAKAVTPTGASGAMTFSRVSVSLACWADPSLPVQFMVPLMTAFPGAARGRPLAALLPPEATEVWEAHQRVPFGNSSSLVRLRGRW